MSPVSMKNEAARRWRACSRSGSSAWRRCRTKSPNRWWYRYVSRANSMRKRCRSSTRRSNVLGVAAVGYGRATLRVKHVEDRSREQEVEDLRGLAFEHFGSEEVGDGAWGFRELGQEEIGDRFVAKGDGRHLDAGGPPVSACREHFDFGLVQLDSELGDDGGDLGLRESEFGVADFEQLSMCTKAVERELGLGSASDDHTTAVREALDERGQAGRRSRGELEVVDHDHDRFTQRREVVHYRDRDVAEFGIRLGKQVGRVEPTVGPPASKRGGERRPKRGRIGVDAHRMKARLTQARGDRAARIPARRSCLRRARRRRPSAGGAHLRRARPAGDGVEHAGSGARVAKTSSRPAVAESGSCSFARRSPPIG